MRYANRFTCTVAIAALAIGAPITAQCENDPVPTRLSFEMYGKSTGTPSHPKLGLELDVISAQPAVTITNGAAGNLACTVVGTRATKVALPFGAIGYVMPDVAVLPALFNHQARCPLPVNLADTSLVGRDVYFQGVNLGPTAGINPAVVVFQFSKAMVVHWVKGNEQPKLDYLGPLLTAIPVYEITDEDMLPDIRLRTSIAATLDHEFRFDAIHTDNKATHVFMTVFTPDTREAIQPPGVLHRVVHVGVVPSARVEVWVAVMSRGNPSMPVYNLAAVVHTGY